MYFFLGPDGSPGNDALEEDSLQSREWCFTCLPGPPGYFLVNFVIFYY